MSGTIRMPIRILGLDPGLSAMGWGVIALEGTRLTHIEHGVTATKPALGLGVRLMRLHAELSAVIARLSPSAIAVEQAFVARDPQAAADAMMTVIEQGWSIVAHDTQPVMATIRTHLSP